MTAPLEPTEASRRHSMVAAVFDVLVANVVLSFSIALASALRQDAVDLEVFWIALPIFAVAIAAYHLLAADRTDLLTPGERLGGRTHALRGKLWHSTFTRSRAPLFAVVAASLALAPHAWSGMWTGSILSATDLGVGLVLAALLLSGALAACGGSREAIVWLCVYHLLVGGLRYRSSGGLGAPWDAAGDSAGFRIALAATCLVLVFWYRKR